MDVSFSIRPATEDDLALVLDIERKVHIAPWVEENFRSELTKPYSQFMVLTDDETDSKVSGYIVYWVMFDECQILNVAVDLPYRGLGFAKQMIRNCANQALKRGLKRVILDVRRSNLAAIQLYQALGFCITQVRKSFYSNSEDAYQMSLEVVGEKTGF